MKVACVIVAAGRGSRAGAGLPKQYRRIAGETVLARTARVFLTHSQVTAVRVIIHPDDEPLYARTAEDLAKEDRLLPPVFGGAERQDSVRRGLQSLEDIAPDIVLIHDAARPFVDHGVISRVIAGAAQHGGAIAALPVFDTLKRAYPGKEAFIDTTAPRDDIWRAQTPQGFDYAAILKAHEACAGKQLTDDAAVAEEAGLTVALVPGSPNNMKLTQAEDFGMAETLLTQGAMEHRVGQGYDVHAFEPGDGVTLCGVTIPHTAKLSGHSDADVAMHALTDALFGAIGAGDIGVHFPPSDAQWKGAPSEIFLKKARDLVAEAGGRIVNADVTIICEAPKVNPHREAMQARLSDILGISAARISIKATTTEKLGFTGRREGIAALATASVATPMGE